MGVLSGLCIGAGVGVGYWIDTSTRAGVGAVFAGLAVGLVVAFVTNYFTIRKFF